MLLDWCRGCLHSRPLGDTSTSRAGTFPQLESVLVSCCSWHQLEARHLA